MTTIVSPNAPTPRLSMDDYIARRVSYWTGKLTRQLHLSRQDAEDFQQDMYVEVYRAMQRFESDQSGRRTYISHVLKRYAKKLIRKTMRHRRHQANLAVSLDGAGDAVIHASSQPPDATHQIDLRVDLQIFLQSLSPRLQRVARLLMVHSPGQAGREMGWHRSSVSRAMSEMRDKLIQVGFEPSDLCSS